jgi:hypothetical protein
MKLFNFMNYTFPRPTKIAGHHYLIIVLLLVILILLLAGCSPQPVTFTPKPPTHEPIEPTSQPTLTLTSAPQLLSPPYFVWVDPALPEPARVLISQQTEFNLSNSKEQALMTFSAARSEQPIGSWTYLLVAPFYSSLDNILFSDLSSLWKSGSINIPEISRLLMSEETKNYLSQFMGIPFTEGLSLIENDLILEEIWHDSTALAIIPFDHLEPSYKVISVDNHNPLNSSADDLYPLTFPIYLSIPDPALFQPFQITDITNFDPSKLTSVVMTGVTAMVRDTAAIMEDKGVRYPGDDIRDILISADITHINNEVPFAADCPPPDSNQDSLSFCSSDSYIELLESIGADIIELSGDHLNDHGVDAMFHTLEIYSQHGLVVYGGGKTLQDGLEPVFIEHNGNKIAFIGCNAKSAEIYGTASITEPGASRCDFDWMIPEISRLSDEGYLVISTMQHEEVDSFFPIALQLYDFRRLSDAGASIVSGSQAHHPQGIEIAGSKFIHYGLGNLFFDQWHLARYNPDQHINKDKAFIDFHYIYDGSYINTRLIPLQFIDNARPRVMTEEEEDLLLEDFFEASKWNNRWIYLYATGYIKILENQ